MKRSSRCECGQYSPVLAVPAAGVAIAKCKCGLVTRQNICTECGGTGWAGVVPCACDVGLCWEKKVTRPITEEKSQSIVFGEIPLKRNKRSG